MHECFGCYTSLIALCVVSLLILVILVSIQWYFNVVLICISLVTDVAEAFLCAY